VGDNVYPSGTTAQFANCYDPNWGRHKARTHPAVGNHEYDTTGASGYYGYFGAAASPLDSNCTSNCKGYYSYDLGAWHIIVLNSNCALIGGCGPTNPQGQWLQADLAANPRACTLAIMHHPLFSSTNPSSSIRPLWQQLYAAGADVVLSGHMHNYERFALQNPNGAADPGRGIREFVVGTGGAGLASFNGISPNSEVRNSTTWGVLKLTLHPTSYDWQFVPVAGQTFTDSGSANCVTP
jgi:acid phosphatase type 7